MRKRDCLSVILFTILLSGCLGTLQTLNTARQLYSNSRAVYTGYNAAVSAKDTRMRPRHLRMCKSSKSKWRLRRA
jgi:uncharacterized protein YceK